MRRILGVLLAAIVLSGCQQVGNHTEAAPAPTPSSRPAPPPAKAENVKLAELNDFGRYLFAEGVWRADDLTEKSESALDSVTRLECYRSGGREIVATDAYCMQATAEIGTGNFPNVIVDYYPVVSWDKDRVIAADSPTAPLPICVWTQVTINLRDHSIMATDTRKLGKGHEGFQGVCKEAPLAQTYHLVDRVQEFVRRQVRASQAKKGE